MLKISKEFMRNEIISFYDLIFFGFVLIPVVTISISVSAVVIAITGSVVVWSVVVSIPSSGVIGAVNGVAEFWFSTMLLFLHRETLLII